MRLVLLGLVLACATGCSGIQSLNLQRAGLRAGGDVVVTAYLDAVDADKVVAQHAELDGVVARLNEFLTTGAVHNLAFPALVEAVRRLVPATYAGISEGLLATVQHTEADVNVAVIGPENVARVRAFLDGAATGLRAYIVEHRPPPSAGVPGAGTAPTPAPAEATPAPAGGNGQ